MNGKSEAEMHALLAELGVYRPRPVDFGKGGTPQTPEFRKPELDDQGNPNF